MRILIAPDKFKGSLSAREVADHIAAGLRDRLPDAIIKTLPIADGGEGTADVIRDACGGETVRCAAHDALGRAIEAQYVWLSESATAVMEMSAAAGLWRIAPEERDLLSANTYGVGEMMNDAAKRGAKEILLGLGGSATNDGGIGMARALGFRFIGTEGDLAYPGDLTTLTGIVSSNAAENSTALSRRVRAGPIVIP
jgi:glycerate kinase